LSDLKIKSSIRDYDVLFGRTVSESLQKNLISDDTIIIDRKVYRTFGDDDQKIIAGHKRIILDASEDQKSYLALAPMIEKIIVQKFRRGNRLVAIGGGITQDITAFIASVLYRGVDWIFFPTTLLAQADSCIGGKTSINIGKSKNQLGNFYPPSKIIIIPELVKSLPLLDFKSGMGEMLHFFLVSGAEDYELYKANYKSAFTDDEVLLKLVRRNLEIKKGFIEQDEFDRGERLLLNYGHSFGHAIESLSGYSIPHGIAVSYGMDIANFISVKMGFLNENVRNDIRSQLVRIWNGTNLGEIDVGRYEKALSKDKKNIGETYRLILSKGVGEMFIHSLNPSIKFTRYLSEYFKAQGNI